MVVAYLPLLPLDRRFVVAVVHSEDLANALVRVLQQRPGGAFNLAADNPLTREVVAEVLGARALQVPAPVLRAVVASSWRLRLQPLSPGWIDLAFAVPLQSCARAHDELGWRPSVDSRLALTEAIDGIAANVGTESPALRPRSVTNRLHDLLPSGPVSQRKQS